ncbi:NADH pyrophosphatase [Thiorhodovibrio winogradskyi]|uniref:NADH pyrophosphatase n=1 Tax=Thiorhodovibrio winogradskyi TaxID=77007 RepID=A0ABZ0S672_9GAMM|nr:NUDIX hydrolase [Thiorhodovibrio winogradskyi]
MKFCSECGAPVAVRVPQGDHRPRHVCKACGTVHYQNPKVVVGCIAQWEDKILLCKRAIEPRRGFWTLPAGFMENGESAREGAARETLEEANARVDIGPLYSLFNLPHIGQLYLLFRARLLDLDFSAGDESTEVGLFTEAELPWSGIAFAVVTETLKLYFSDRGSAGTLLHSGDIHRETTRNPGSERHYRVLLY